MKFILAEPGPVMLMVAVKVVDAPTANVAFGLSSVPVAPVMVNVAVTVHGTVPSLVAVKTCVLVVGPVTDPKSMVLLVGLTLIEVTGVIKFQFIVLVTDVAAIPTDRVANMATTDRMIKVFLLICIFVFSIYPIMIFKRNMIINPASMLAAIQPVVSLVP